MTASIARVCKGHFLHKNTVSLPRWTRVFSSGSLPPHQVLSMPALSPTMAEGTLSRWKKAVGDAVKPGDSLAEIETDKATMDWECQEQGYIAKIIYPDGGKDIPIGKPLLVIVENKDDIASIPDSIFQESPKQDPSNSVSKTSAPVLEEAQPNFEPSKPTKVLDERPQMQKPDFSSSSSSRLKISPLARKLAAENKLDLSSLHINGSGPGGRIVENDITSIVDKQKQVKPAFFGKEMAKGVTVQRPLSNMRRTIAKRLTESTTTIPHFHLNCKVNVDSLLGIRKRINSHLAIKHPGTKVSVNDFIIKAVAVSLKEHPGINASWMGDSIHEYSNVDISIAVSTGEGLITPIVFNADKLGLLETATEVKRLAAKAKAQTLAPNEFMGGTFTISNLGMFGVTSFTSIINLPQAAILSVGATETVWRPIQQILEQSNEDAEAVEEDKLIPCSEMTLTLGCDHRVVDGALGTQFLKTLKSLLEDPAQMLL
ncbi:hypothetical protein MDAP_001073 [Mitosporidium daphniae]